MSKSCYLLGDLEAPLRAALERLAESPRELRCFVVAQEPLTKRFVQFCTPPPPSPFAGSGRTCCDDDEPLIYDGYGDGKPGGYVNVNECCIVDVAVIGALDNLERFLPKSALVEIEEEATHKEPPS